MRTQASFRFLISLALILSAFAGCAKSAPQGAEPLGQNLQTNANPVDSSIGPYRGIRGDVLSAKEALGQLVPISDPSAVQFLRNSQALSNGSIFIDAPASQIVSTPPAKPAANSLILGYPIGLLGTQSDFGAVITKVDAVTNANLGDMKLTDLPMLHVRTLIAGLDTQAPSLALVGCQQDCTDSSAQEILVMMPILAVDTQNSQVQIDVSALGKSLDLIGIADPSGQQSGLTTLSTEATAMDFSLETLVFDVESHMIAISSGPNPDPGQGVLQNGQAQPPVTFTTRWYLHQGDTFNPAFVSRPATPGLGYFMTSRSVNSYITRRSSTDYGNKSVKYYIKNVPAEFQPAFKDAMEDWNTQMKAIVGHDILDYEFVAQDDPRNALLVPGDIRYNIIEWDLVNEATYGGLGPSIANQFTGEISSANIYIQGPTIVQLYTNWYKVSKAAQDLRAQGQVAQAEAMMHDFAVQRRTSEQPRAENLQLTLNSAKSLDFRVAARVPGLADPSADRNDFFELPSDVDFDTYMYGYFRDMVSHEMGHNWGLRHNFRGNLASDDSGKVGTVSDSVMEYLSRDFRYLDRIDSYDKMAIAYGYTGALPKQTTLFCTDEDQPSAANPGFSAECTENDATSDPFSYFESELSQSIDYLTSRGTTAAPSWAMADMQTVLVGQVMPGLLSYASSAAKTSSGWTNFFGKPGRPTNAADVPAYVLGRIKQQICDPNFDTLIAGKVSPNAKTAVQKNLSDLRAAFVATAKTFNAVFSEADLACSTAAVAPAPAAPATSAAN